MEWLESTRDKTKREGNRGRQLLSHGQVYIALEEMQEKEKESTSSGSITSGLVSHLIFFFHNFVDNDCTAELVIRIQEQRAVLSD